jgi:uncharacterized protein YjiS (DUF1127 family)
MTTIDTSFSHHATARERTSLRDGARAAWAGFGTLLIQLLEWQERARQRRLLLSLPDGALKDFGASRADAEGEGARPFWHA